MGCNCKKRLKDSGIFANTWLSGDKLQITEDSEERKLLRLTANNESCLISFAIWCLGKWPSSTSKGERDSLNFKFKCSCLDNELLWVEANKINIAEIEDHKKRDFFYRKV